jgi:hypothetical protein
MILEARPRETLGWRPFDSRPSLWQGDLQQLCHLRLHIFINVLLGFLPTAVDRYTPLLSMLCAFFVVHVPRVFAPHAPRTLEDLALLILWASPWKSDAWA